MSCSRLAFSDDYMWDKSVQTRKDGAVYGPLQQCDYPRQNWRLPLRDPKRVDLVGHRRLEVHIGVETNRSLRLFEIQREGRTRRRYLKLLQHAPLWYRKVVRPAYSLPLEGPLWPPHELVWLGLQHVPKRIVSVHQSARVQNLAIHRPCIWVPINWKQNPKPHFCQLYPRIQRK